MFTPGGWWEWLEKIGPELIFQNTIREDSIFARIMRRPDLLTKRAFKLPIKGLPYHIEPDPMTSGAFFGPSRYFTVVDDIDFSQPAQPKPTKEFIYGDRWNAYRRLGK